jgi:hypothetical protein
VGENPSEESFAPSRAPIKTRTDFSKTTAMRSAFRGVESRFSFSFLVAKHQKRVASCTKRFRIQTLSHVTRYKLNPVTVRRLGGEKEVSKRKEE